MWLANVLTGEVVAMPSQRGGLTGSYLLQVNGLACLRGGLTVPVGADSIASVSLNALF